MYAGPKSARNILANLSPNPARREKPGLTYNSAATTLYRMADPTEGIIYVYFSSSSILYYGNSIHKKNEAKTRSNITNCFAQSVPLKILSAAHMFF